MKACDNGIKLNQIPQIKEPDENQSIILQLFHDRKISLKKKRLEYFFPFPAQVNDTNKCILYGCDQLNFCYLVPSYNNK